MSVGIRDSSEEDARVGPAAALGQVTDALGELRTLLTDDPPENVLISWNRSSGRCSAC